MNTNSASMSQRCPSAVDLGPAHLPDHTMVFNYYCDIVPAAGGAMPGVLWEIDEDTLTQLDYFEGFPEFYQRKQVQVVCNNLSGWVNAWVYYMPQGEPGKPSTMYYECVHQGYAQHGLNTEILSDALRCVDKYSTQLTGEV